MVNMQIVSSVEENSIGMASGVKCGDVICYSMTDKGLEGAQQSKHLYQLKAEEIEKTFITAKEQHRNIILLIQRV